MRRTVNLPLAALAAVALLAGLTSCGNDDDTATEEPAATTATTMSDDGQVETTTTVAPSGTGDDSQDGDDQTGNDQATSGSVEGSHTLASEVGEIDFDFTAGSLTLQDVRPTGGWSHVIDEEGSDEIEIDFRHDDGRFVQVEIDVDDGQELDFKVDYEQGLPEGRQTLVVGSIGEIDHEVTDGALQLVDVRPGQGWSHRVDEEDSDEIEIDFRSDDGTTVEVAIEIED